MIPRMLACRLERQEATRRPPLPPDLTTEERAWIDALLPRVPIGDGGEMDFSRLTLAETLQLEDIAERVRPDLARGDCEPEGADHAPR